MVHAVSVSYLRSEHMSPPAAGMALALHVAVALALWWVSPLSFRDVEPQQPIEVTMEAPVPNPPEVAQPAAPPPAPSPSAAASRPPPPPPKAEGALGLPPLPTPEPPKAQSPKPEPRKPEPPAAVEPQQALAAPKIEAKPAPEPVPPPIDKVLPTVEAPPAPLTMKDFVKIAPPPAPREVLKPLPQQVAPSPPAPQQLRPSPLTSAPQQASRDAGNSSSTFVNPATNSARNLAHEDYISQVGRRLQQSRFVPKESYVYTRRGVIGVSMVVARDGRLIKSSISRSSGEPTFDTDMLAFIRSLSPYPPLPRELPGEQYSFTILVPYDLNPGR